jgi:hypothetical protein
VLLPTAAILLAAPGRLLTRFACFLATVGVCQFSFWQVASFVLHCAILVGLVACTTIVISLPIEEVSASVVNHAVQAHYEVTWLGGSVLRLVLVELGSLRKWRMLVQS